MSDKFVIFEVETKPHKNDFYAKNYLNFHFFIHRNDFNGSTTKSSRGILWSQVR